MQIQPNTTSKRRVSYFYNPEISKYTYSKQHPMKPERIAMTHSLIVNYNLYRHLDVYSARQATKEQLKKFHSSDYIDYLENYVSKEIVNKFGSLGIGRYTSLINQDQRKNNLLNIQKKQKYKIGESTDCPGFPGLYNFCQFSTGGSIDSATTIINNQTDIAINWGGGLHHAKKCQASGFCYTNDIVICILQLLQIYPRVLYIDIDVHHGDGVEQAFFLTNRVMTVSFHQYSEEFFPGTGNIDSIGYSEGKYYSLNVPLKMGMTDDCYLQIFKDIMKRVLDRYRPSVIVMQLGADSLAHDKLGQFNLSIKGHGACLKYILSYGIPTIMVGGGGYTVQNVARCWAYETGVALGIQLQNPIPKNDPYFSKYSFQQKLHIPVKTMQNQNKADDLNKIRQKIYQHLNEIQMAPGVQFHYVPRFSEWNTYLQQQSTDEYGQRTLNFN